MQRRVLTAGLVITFAVIGLAGPLLAFHAATRTTSRWLYLLGFTLSPTFMLFTDITALSVGFNVMLFVAVGLALGLSRTAVQRWGLFICFMSLELWWIVPPLLAGDLTVVRLWSPIAAAVAVQSVPFVVRSRL